MSKELVAMLLALLAFFGLAVANQPGAGEEPINPPPTEMGPSIDPGG